MRVTIGQLPLVYHLVVQLERSNTFSNIRPLSKLLEFSMQFVICLQWLLIFILIEKTDGCILSSLKGGAGFCAHLGARVGGIRRRDLRA